MATQIQLGARLNIESTGSDKVEKQIESLEKDLVGLGTGGDEAGKRWLKSLIEVAKMGKEVISTLEKIGNAKITIDPAALGNFQSGLQSAVEAGITNGIKNALTASQAGKIAQSATGGSTQASAKDSKTTGDLTTSINRLEQTISSFAITLGRQAQGSNIQERIQEVTGRPQFVPFQELGEISTRQQGKAIRGAADEIVALLGQAEQTIEIKKKEVRELVAALKSKINISELTSGITLSANDLGASTGAVNTDIISDELMASIGKKLNVEMLSDVDQMMKLFHTGFDKAKKQGYTGISLLLDGQKKWLSETEAGQKLMAQMAVQFFRSSTPITKMSPQVLQSVDIPESSGPFNMEAFKGQLGESGDANELRTMLGLVESLFKTYEDVEATKLSITQIDKQGNDVSSNNLQRLERMLAMNRDQLALAKENNAVSVRYNTILQQNNDLVSRGVDSLNEAVASNDLAQIAVLQRQYSNQQQKSVNLEKQLQQLIERNRNLQQGSMGQLKRELDDLAAKYLNIGSNIGKVTQVLIAQDKAKSASGGTPQFSGFIGGLKSAAAGLDDILAPFANGNRLANTMIGGDFVPAFAAGLKKAMADAAKMAADNPEMASALATSLDDVSNRIFELASASQGAEGIDGSMSASLLEMATEMKNVGSRAREAAAGVDLYTEGLGNSIAKQEAVRQSSASVEEVLKRVRSQFRIGDESTRIIERIQRQSQRVSSEVQQTLSESKTIMSSLNKPLSLFDRETVTNAKSFLETLRNVTRASEQNLASLEEGRRLSMADIRDQGQRARNPDTASATMFAGLSGAELDAKIAETEAKYNDYYDGLIAEASSSAKQMAELFNRSFADINSKVQLGSAYNSLADGLDKVKLKITGLTNQYASLNAAQTKNSSGIIMNAQDMKQLTADASSLSREIRQLEANEKALVAEMSKLKAQDNAFGTSSTDLIEASKRVQELRNKIIELKKDQEGLSNVRFSQGYISQQQVGGTLEKTRTSADRLIGSVDVGDVTAQMKQIKAAASSMDLDSIARSLNDFKALKGTLASTFAEASKGIATYDALISRGVKLDATDRAYMQTLRGVKKETSDLLMEMAKQEGSMKSAESRVKQTTQTFDDYANSIYQGVKSQVDFAIGAGALTGAVAAIGMGFRELLSEARMLSRTLTVLQSDILSTEQVSRVAYDMTRKLAVEYGMTVSSVADVAKELGSAGMKLEEVNRAWEDTLRAINATNAETTQVTRAVAGIYNVYRKELREAGNEANEVGVITDVLTSIFRNHQAEMDEIVQGYKFVVGTGKTAGFTFQEMGSYLAVLNDNMIKSGMAGRGLQTVFAQTAAKTGQLAEMFNIKLDPSKTIASQFNSLLEQMNEKIGGVEVSARDMNKIFQIFDREGARAFTTLVQQYPAVQKALHETEFAASGVTAEMNLLVNQSLDRRFFQMKQAILDVARQGFDKLQPAMIKILEVFKSVALATVNFNAAFGGLPVKLAAVSLGFSALLTVGRSLAALMVGFKNMNLAGGVGGMANYFLSASEAGKAHIATQSKSNALIQERIVLEKQLAVAQKASAFSANNPLSPAQRLPGNLGSGLMGAQFIPAQAQSDVVATKNRLAEVNKELDIARAKSNLFGAALSSAMEIAAPMILIGVLFKLGEEINKLQNRTSELKEGIDKSVSSAARLSSELFRLSSSEKPIRKLVEGIGSGMLDAQNAGRSLREIIDGFGADAQVNFVDLASMSDEEIGRNAMAIADRVAQYKLDRERQLNLEIKKDQTEALNQRLEVLKRNTVAAGDIMKDEWGPIMNSLVSLPDSFKRGASDIGKGNLMDGGIGLAGSSATVVLSPLMALIGGVETLTLKTETYQDMVTAFNGQNPAQIKKQKDAIIAVTSAMSKRVSEEERLRAVSELNAMDNFKVDPYDPKSLKDFTDQFKRSRSELVGIVTQDRLIDPEQKQLFETFIGDLTQIRAQLRATGMATSEVDKRFKTMLDGMGIGAEGVTAVLKRLEERSFTALMIPDVSPINYFEALTGEVEDLRNAFNWQVNGNQFKGVQDSALAAQIELKDLREDYENFLKIEGGTLTGTDAFKARERMTENGNRSRVAEIASSSSIAQNDYNLLTSGMASELAKLDKAKLSEIVKKMGLEVEIPVNPRELTGEALDNFVNNLKAAIDKKLIKKKPINVNVPMEIDAVAAVQLTGQMNKTGDVNQTRGQINKIAGSLSAANTNAMAGEGQANVNQIYNQSLIANAAALAEINSLLKKRNELTGINLKISGGLAKAQGEVKENAFIMSRLDKDTADKLKDARLSEKDRVKLLQQITTELIKQKAALGGGEETDEVKKLKEQIALLQKANADYAAGVKDRIAKNREIAIQLETEKNTLKDKLQLFAQQMIFYTDGYSMSVRTAQIEKERLDGTLRELIVTRQLLGLKKKEGEQIRTIADLYNLVARDSGKAFKSSSESVAAMSKLVDGMMEKVSRQRDLLDKFAASSKMLIETIGITEAVMMGDDDTVYGKAIKSAYDLLARLPEIDAIERKILMVKGNQVDRQNQLIEGSAAYNAIQIETEDQLIQLYAKKAKLLQEMQKSQKDIAKSIKDQLVDDKRPELYQAAADALKQFQDPLEKETQSRLASLFDKNELDTAMGIQATTGDPLMFILNDREEAMRRFMIMAKEGQVNFSALSSSIQNTLEPQLTAYKEMIAYEDKLKQSYIDRAKKVGNNLSTAVAGGDFSRANSLFSTLQSSVLDLTKKTGNELLTVQASERLIEINELMLDAENFQKVMMEKQLDLLNINMEEMQALFKDEAQKIQAILLKTMGADWNSVKAALEGGLDARNEMAETGLEKQLGALSEEINMLAFVIATFANKQKISVADLVTKSAEFGEEIKKFQADQREAKTVGSATAQMQTVTSSAKSDADIAREIERRNKKDNIDRELQINKQKREEIAAQITSLNDSLLTWASNIKDTRVQAEAYSQGLKIIAAGGEKAEDTIQNLGETLLRLKSSANPAWNLLTGLADAFKSVNEVIFSLIPNLGDISYAVENAATYITYLEAIDEATRTYIASVEETTTALKRNETGYYDYINAIQDAEKQRYEALMAAEETYRENLKKTQDIFKESFLGPMKEAAASFLSEKTSGIGAAASSLFSSGLNKAAFGLSAMGLASEIGEVNTPEMKAATKIVDSNEKLVKANGWTVEALKMYADALKNPGSSPTATSLMAGAGTSGSGVGINGIIAARRNDSGVSFGGQVIEGASKMAIGLAGTLLSGAVTAFGSVIGMAFDATINNQTKYLLKFVEKFARELPEMVTGFVESFQDFFPKLVDTLVNDVLPNLIDTLVEVLPILVSTIASTFIQNLGPFVTNIVNGIQKVAGPLLKAVIGAVTDLLPALIDIVPKLAELMPALVVEGVSAILKNLPKIIFATLMAAISIALLPIELIMGAIRAIVKFFGGDIEGFSILKYIAKATKAGVDAIPTFHEGGKVPGSGEKSAVLLGGEGVLNKRAMAILGEGGLNRLNKGYAPVAKAYGALGASQSSKMTQPPSLRKEGLYGAPTQSTINMGGITINAQGADRKAVAYLSDEFVIDVEAKLAKRQSNRSSRLNKG